MTGFARYLKTVLARAGDEARADGSATVEAQHLLLAITDDPGTAAAQTLASVGLDRAGLRAALDREFEHSLNVAGLSASTFDLPAATPDPEREPQLGASVQVALERAAKGARTEPQPSHVVIGILLAEVGTVPRALAQAGIDRTELIARLRSEPATR